MQSNSKKISLSLQNFSFTELDLVDSTNNWAKLHLSSFNPQSIPCIYAVEQTSGRGRLQREWISPRNLNIYATYVLFLPSSFRLVGNLAQLLMCSCYRVLVKHGIYAEFKWPNDLMINQKKVSGVLCEIEKHEGHLVAILGIGLNVNMTQEYLTNIGQPATSLYMETGQTRDWRQLLKELSAEFYKNYQKLVASEDFSSFARLMNQHLFLKSSLVTIRTGSSPITGVCQKVNKDGSLELVVEGKKVKIYSGDLTAGGDLRNSHLESP